MMDEGLKGLSVKSARALRHQAYKEAGFDVDTGKVLRNEPFIDVKMTEASIDKDFYDRGDDPAQPQGTT